MAIYDIFFEMWATFLCFSKETHKNSAHIHLWKQVFGRASACFHTGDVERVECCPVTFLTLPYAVFLNIIKNIVYSDDISMIFLSGLNILLFGMNYFWMWIINVPYICLLVRLTLSEEGRCILSFQLVNVCLLSAQNVCIHLWHCTVSQMNKDNTKLHLKRSLKTVIAHRLSYKQINMVCALQNSNMVLKNKTRTAFVASSCSYTVYTVLRCSYIQERVWNYFYMSLIYCFFLPFSANEWKENLFYL